MFAAGSGRAGGDRHADEIARVGPAHHHIETRQPQRAAGDKHEAGQAAHAHQGRMVGAHLREAVAVQQQAGRAAEVHHVGDRVELHAEIRLGVGGAGDEAVERIEHAGQHQQDGRQPVIGRIAHRGIVDRDDDAAEAAGDRQQGHETGQGELGAREALLAARLQIDGSTKGKNGLFYMDLRAKRIYRSASS
jgi:hypothetical protein